MKQNIKAFIYPEDDGFVVEIPDINAVTQGNTLDETLANLKEVVALALEGEDPADFGLTEHPGLIVTLELGPLSYAG